MGDWRDEVRRRLEGLDLPAERELAILDELSQHLTERETALLASGVPPDQARRIVLDEIAEHELLRRGLQALPQPARLDAPGLASTGGAAWRHLLHDLRYAVRTLSRDRAYTLTAIVALAIGIGCTAAIFGAIDSVLLRPMPYPHADKLMVPVSHNPARGPAGDSVSYADYVDWRAEKDIFAAVALWTQANVDVTGDGDPERVEAAVVSEEFFGLIDVRPQQGRTLQPADHVESAPRVVVLSWRLWQSRFSGADVIGRSVSVSGVPRQIVGVLPPRAVWPDTAALFLPMRPSLYNEDVRTRRDNLIFSSLARLRDDVPIERGNAVLARIAARVEKEHPESRKGWTNRLTPLRESMVRPEVRRGLFVLLGAVLGVLLIVCANVANLALVRGQARARELAIRLSLGASRGRLIQQLVTESLVLAGAGAALGTAVAAGALRGLKAMAPEGTPFLDTMSVDGRVLIAVVAIAALAAFCAGVIPAFVTSGLRLGSAMKDGTAGAGVSRRAARLRHSFVVVEIAGAVVLLVASSLLIRSFSRLAVIDPGVDLDRVLTGRIALPGTRYPDAQKATRFYADLIARLRANTAVENAAAASFVPAGTGGFGLGRVFVAQGRPDPPVGTEVDAMWNVVTPDYFRTVGMTLLRGRQFTDDDTSSSTPVMIVSESFAARMFPGESAVGKRARSWRDENVQREIVGVVTDVRFLELNDTPRSAMYVPHTQNSWGSMLITIRARAGDPLALAPLLRKSVAEADPLLAVANVGTMAEAAMASVAAQRYAAVLLGLLAALAIGLAALGVYGVMTHVFAQRRREMGIRLALGASASSVYGLVFKYGFAMAGLGLAIGCAAAIAASRALEALLSETSPADLASWVAMVVVILAATTVACLLPARRAAHADPVSVLRTD